MFTLSHTLLTCLEDMILDDLRNREGITAHNARVQEKGDKAQELKKKILDMHFLLHLSGLADAYGQFGAVMPIRLYQMYKLCN